MSAEPACYTDSWRKFLTRRVVNAVLCGAASGSGLYGSMVPGSDAYHAVNESYPPLIWWRRGARAGVIAAEQFANSRKPPAPGPDGRPAAAGRPPG